MSQELTLKGIALEKLNRILNPNFDSKFIWALFSGGALLAGYQRIIQICSTLEVVSGGTYVKLSLSSGTDAVFIAIGSVMIFSSIIIFIIRMINSQPGTVKKYKSLQHAAKDLRPLMDENRRVFTAFGPNSESGNVDDLRQDYEVWEQLKMDQIVPNNDEIMNILNRVKVLTKNEAPIVSKMKSHIAAFKKHCSNPNFDYSNDQFPLSFADLIFKYSKSNDNNVGKYGEWLKKSLSPYLNKVESVYIFGSALYGQEKTDVDVIIKNNLVDIEEIREFAGISKELKNAFEKDFSLSLHLKVFSERETQGFGRFLEKIYKSEKVI
jgi:predicted nucleotidyltransferase